MPRKQTDEPDFKGKKIWIADNDPERRNLAEFLDTYNAKTRFFTDHYKLVEALESEKPDMIITDWDFSKGLDSNQRPEFTKQDPMLKNAGSEILRAVKQKSVRRVEIPVIIYSGSPKTHLNSADFYHTSPLILLKSPDLIGDIEKMHNHLFPTVAKTIR